MSSIIQMANAALSLEYKSINADTASSSGNSSSSSSNNTGNGFGGGDGDHIFENPDLDDYGDKKPAEASSRDMTGSPSDVRIVNRDIELAESLASAVSSSDGNNGFNFSMRGSGDLDIVYYQMLFQTWRLRPGVLVPRTVIITDALILLCYEDLRQIPVKISILDSVKPKHVQSIQCDDPAAPLFVTLIIRPTKVLSAVRKWRLKVENTTVLTKFMEEVKRACAKHGSKL
jgi:hypothetical protein